MKKVAIAVLSLASLLLLPGAEAESRRWSPSIGRPPQPGDEYINPADGSVLVFIPGGEFLMGTDGGEADERPAHRVKVEGFWLGKYEVTNKQYMKFMEEEGYPDPAFMDDPDFNHPSQPVLGIKFLHALEYMKWSGLRMPTEAEWEYAASGGKRLEYPTATGKLDHTQANFLGREGPDIWADKPSPVGSFPAGPYGLFDLAGNAWEWTSSAYKPYPYSADDGRENVTERRFRVMRGGSYHFGGRYLRTAQRHQFRMHLRLDFAGLRVAASTGQLK
jgi:formylglycine-generating enzyme required for sulfatase activity